MIGEPADTDRVRWLTKLAAACDRILTREDEAGDWSYQQVRQDVEELLARIKAELKGER